MSTAALILGQGNGHARTVVFLKTDARAVVAAAIVELEHNRMQRMNPSNRVTE